MRIEDHDRQRSRSEFVDSIQEDLDWLGFIADGPTVRQSARDAIYQAQLNLLKARARVYACSCSRRDIVGERPVPLGVEPRYPGACRERGLQWKPGLSLRVEMDDGVERFDDVLLGHQEQRPALQCGDLSIKDRLNNWTYQYAASVDDYVQGVNLVIRGVDLLASTGRQITLGRMLGRSAPAMFLHHPLVMKVNGEKLSKSSGDSGVRELRATGVAPEEVLGRAAFLASLIDVEMPLTLEAFSAMCR
jgi:glutamyl-tRNA synthetase/glutamyl-Q tRNA(Asp) synthetase